VNQLFIWYNVLFVIFLTFLTRKIKVFNYKILHLIFNFESKLICFFLSIIASMFKIMNTNWSIFLALNF